LFGFIFISFYARTKPPRLCSARVARFVACFHRMKFYITGTGDSGKSTAFKQILHIFHKSYFDEEQRILYQHDIQKHAIKSMKIILAAAKQLNLVLSPTNQLLAKTVEDCQWELTKELVHIIKRLYNDNEMQEAVRYVAQRKLCQNLHNTLSRIDILCTPEYVPTVEEILYLHIITTGRLEIEFEMNDSPYVLVDVGGARSERRKWIHFFEGVAVVIFLIPLSDYDLTLRECSADNRMLESLKLFKEMLEFGPLQCTPIILLFTKIDLLRTKLAYSDLSVLFPEYTGGSDYESALNFLTAKFLALNTNPHRLIFTKNICTTDTECMKQVLEEIKNRLVSKS